MFSCFNQDQKLDEMDWDNLAARLRQNTVSEKLTNLWIERLFSRTSEPIPGRGWRPMPVGLHRSLQRALRPEERSGRG